MTEKPKQLQAIDAVIEGDRKKAMVLLAQHEREKALRELVGKCQVEGCDDAIWRSGYCYNHFIEVSN
jgi:hypothetical protein